MKITINTQVATDVGETRHAQTIMADYGIRYASASHTSEPDAWEFDVVDPFTAPSEWPPYIEVVLGPNDKPPVVLSPEEQRQQWNQSIATRKGLKESHRAVLRNVKKNQR
jgi:hypothetical protein